MALRLDAVRLGVADPGEATAAYSRLLGISPHAIAGDAWRFQLGRGAVEIVAGDPGLVWLRFLREPSDPELPADGHGIPLRTDPDEGPAPTASAGAPVAAIDHVVVQTVDAGRALGFWRDRPGVRLALDREFPARGLRLVFFRTGGITLEYATPHPPPAAPAGVDRFHGLSYRVTDLAAQRERLVAAGIDVSPIRPGMRPGTTVASVRSGTAGVPTLLLQVEPGPDPG